MLKKQSFNVVYQGGIGNQLFIHASHLQLKKITSASFYTDIKTRFFLDKKYKRTFKIDNLFDYNFRHSTNWLIYHRFSILKLIGKHVLSPLGLTTRIIRDKDYGYIIDDIKNRELKGSFVLDGYFQHCNYDDSVFKDMYRSIKKELIKKVDKTYNEVVTGENISAVIHVRAFKDDPGEFEFLSNYYQRAIKFLNTFESISKFYIVSEDRSLAERLLRKSSDNSYFFYCPSGSEAEDLLLISKFKHIIGSESSFSWWGAKFGEISGNTLNIIISKRNKDFGESSWKPDNLKCEGWLSV